MHHYIYKITVLTGEYANHWYIGKRSCDCDIENDSYMGSGAMIMEIEPYEECRKEILSVWPTEEEAYSEEERLVTKETLKNRLCLNLIPGGRGGWKSDKPVKKEIKIPKSCKTRWWWNGETYVLNYHVVKPKKPGPKKQYKNKEKVIKVRYEPSGPLKRLALKKARLNPQPIPDKTKPIPKGYTKRWWWNGETYIENNMI